MFKEQCGECGQIVAAEDPVALGFVRAVHLHDDHPEAFEELADSARTMIEIAQEELDESDLASGGVVHRLLDGFLGVGGSREVSMGPESREVIKNVWMAFGWLVAAVALVGALLADGSGASGLLALVALAVLAVVAGIADVKGVRESIPLDVDWDFEEVGP